MSEVKWTAEQSEAIKYSGENILLAAAAGSGKTAVLVQRIIEMISDRTRDISINELLVLTFTDAAASEMREKISDAIDRALEENPTDEHINRQKLLLHSANISTVHSFCMNILRSNVHLTDLPVNFSLISETEGRLMLSETMDDVLERFYGRIERDPSIAALVMGYGGIKNDATLREAVLGLFHFSKSMANPALWLNKAVRDYKETAKSGSFNGSGWQKALFEIVEKSRADIFDIYDTIFDVIDERLQPSHPYAGFFADEAASVKRTFLHIAGANYSTARAAVFGFEFKRMASGVRGASGELFAAQEKIKALRELAKGIMEDLQVLFRAEESELLERIRGTYPLLRTLKNMVLMLDRGYTRRKRAKCFLDFSDLEHEALKLLTADGEAPSSAAKALRERYKEILIDEYQDTNNIQDTLFKILSRDNGNIFMVGDLKQSIYTFRAAVPQLFSEKYETYEKIGGGHLIRLFKNFRSREGIVNAVNFVFACIMSRDVGDVDYTEEEYLVRGAEYPEPKDKKSFETELHLICSNSPAEEGAQPRDKNELEALVAAKRIRDMLDGKTEVFDKKSGRMRPMEYRDIVVLMRNTKTAAPIFERIFTENGIPVYSEIGKGYLASAEVQTVLAYLQITDNPRQDIPLIAVMRSPVWGFSADELAELRADMRSGCFFDAVKNAASSGNEKAAAFVSELEHFRELAEHSGVDRLIRHIYYEYGYYAYVGAMTRGSERQANLDLLFERAAEFEHTRLSGLFSFINYIEAIKSRGDDMTAAKTFGDGDNAVRIMTVHKSKGLEFPVVILSDTSRDFNMSDLRKNILWNSSAGLAADFVDTRLRVRYPSLPRDLAATKAKGELMSEEMRLLYVALTRAREKLIVTATFKQTKKGLAMPIIDSDGRAKKSYIKSKHCFRDWLLAAFLTHPEAKPLREYFGFDEEMANSDADFELSVKLYENEAQIPPSGAVETEAELKAEDAPPSLDGDFCERLEYEYPNRALCRIPIKMSVSEAKRMQAEEGEQIPRLKELRVHSEVAFERPEGAERGTIVHFVLQLADPQKINSVYDLEKLVEELKQNGTLNERQSASVDCLKLFGFFESSLGRRLKNAVRVEREFSFYTEARANELYSDVTDGKILLQGTMDCFFVEKNGRSVLLDFKTDRVRDKEAAEYRAKSYSAQMKYYKKALSEILGKAVDECYLYFLECGAVVEM